MIVREKIGDKLAVWDTGPLVSVGGRYTVLLRGSGKRRSQVHRARVKLGKLWILAKAADTGM
jgi:hypothetical protein